MAEYRYVAETEVIYPDIVIPGAGSLIGRLGAVIKFTPPADGRWVLVEPPKQAPLKTGKNQKESAA